MTEIKTGYNDLGEQEFLIDYIKQINEELSLFHKIYYDSQFDSCADKIRKTTFENIQIITKQKREFIDRLKKEFEYDFKD